MESTKGRVRIKAYLYVTIFLLIIATILCIPAEGIQQHIELINTRTDAYQIVVGGTLDEFNTAEYLEAPLGSSDVGYKRLESKFQPNEYLIIENVGDTNVVNPRIVINGRRDWYSADDILAGLLQPGMTEAEKAMAIWTFANSIELQCHDNDRRVGDGSITINKELTNPVKWANCYYCSGCQFAAAVIVVLCQQAGFTVPNTRTSAMGSAHRIAEIWHDGDWHVYDGDERVFHLENDNTTLASYDDLHDNPPLCDRTHSGGFASPGLLKKRGGYYRDNIKKITSIDSMGRLSTMAMTLRPGEKFQWNWDHIGKWRHGANTRDPLGLLEPYQLANGEMTYEPNLTLFPHGSSERLNVHSVLGSGQVYQLEPIVVGSGYVIYEVNTPYPVVGGRIGGKFFRKTDSDACRLFVYNPNDDAWINVWNLVDINTVQQYEKDIDSALDTLLTEPIYQYYVKFMLFSQNEPNDSFMKDIYIETDVQMSGTALPSLSVGTNNVTYRDGSDPCASAKLTHGWEENSATIPPSPPAKPVKPQNGWYVPLELLDKLEWEAATDTDGSILDYHIQVSTRSDMLYPVSPNFDRISFSALPEWELPCATSWLKEGQRYYWRVRAKDNWGAWSNWSDVWSFTVSEVLNGDLNDNWVVDFNDLMYFTDKWLADCLIEDCNGANFKNDNNSVDFADFALLAQQWLDPYIPFDPNIDLVGWYRLDETSGVIAYDSSGYGYDGIFIGGPSWELAGGKSGGAVRFEGSSERIQIPTTAMTNSTGTVCLWARPEGPQSGQRDKFVFGCYDGSSNRIQLYIGDDWDTRLTLGLGASYEIRENIMTLNTDAWYHIALTWNQTDNPAPGNGDYAVYVNCCRVVTGSYDSINTLPTIANIGNSGESGPTGGFLGLIDEVRIYDRALDADQIRQIYESLL